MIIISYYRPERSKKGDKLMYVIKIGKKVEKQWKLKMVIRTNDLAQVENTVWAWAYKHKLKEVDCFCIKAKNFHYKVETNKYKLIIKEES